MNLFATCAPGLEDVLAAELWNLGADAVDPKQRGVAFEGEAPLMWRVCLASRVASRVLRTVAEFPARDRDALYRGVRRVTWRQYIEPPQTLAVSAVGGGGSLSHTGFIAQVVKDAICDQLREETGRRPDVDRRAPDLPVSVRLVNEQCTVSLDACGPPLHRRGYRIEAGEAPLRETLAAGILALAGWDGQEPLYDPMCGAGTFLIEAAMLARRIPPGLARLTAGGEGFAFQRWLGHSAAALDAVVAELLAGVRPDCPVPLAGSDADATVLSHGRRNAARAGVADDVELRRRALNRARPLTARGMVVVNPPYGVRLGADEDLEALYGQLGDILKQHFVGHTAWILVGDPDLGKCIGLRASQRIPVFNGPIECRLMRFDLYESTGP